MEIESVKVRVNEYNLALGKAVVDVLNVLNGLPTPLNYRRGQFLFNEFRENFPKIADAIRGTICDPYYHDELIPAFFAKAVELAFESQETY